MTRRVISLVAALFLFSAPALAQAPATFHLDVDPITAPLYSGHVVVTGAVYDTARPWDGVGAVLVQTRPVWIDGTPLAGWSQIAGIRYGQARPEVAAKFGTPVLTEVGFSISVPLSSGFHQVLVTALLPDGTPAPGVSAYLSVDSSLRMFIDIAQPGSVFPAGAPIAIAGWAFDASYSLGGSGIERITVCARRVDVTAHACQPVSDSFLRLSRPDVALAYGAYYGNAGFWTATVPTLPAGVYDLVVTASTLGGVNNYARTVRVTIR